MTIAYEEIKNRLKTGDIVLFSGKYTMSKMVEKLEHSRWSHCGMVVRLPEYDEPLIYEATALTNLEDLVHHDHITGPKVVNLLERLKTYGQDVEPYEPPTYAVRLLDKPLPEADMDILNELLKELHGLPNPDEKRMIFEVLVGRYLYIKTKMKDITCSGFISYTYKKLGLLKSLKPINGYMPKDFSTDGHLNLKGVTLSNEIVIDIHT
ncbi:MAG: hypothetical protein CVV02_16290 [Firmicutes bacterium HGW-Firmicutes-7]|nr:MAG: hypothetical protein CVV02_16290 [Firmicutes bacterium HGW-Firmicutes-7]